MSITSLEDAEQYINNLTNAVNELKNTVSTMSTDKVSLEQQVASLIENNTSVIIREIQSQLAMLQKCYGSIANTYYNMFYNPVPMDISLQLYDENGEYKTITVPNRAKMSTANLTYYGSPEGQVEASLGALCLDTQNLILYYKTTTSGTDGWVVILSAHNWEAGYNYVEPGGDGSTLRDLNVSNVATGVLRAEYGGTGVKQIERKEQIDADNYTTIVKGIVKVVVDEVTGRQQLVIAEPGVDYMASSTLAGSVMYVPRETAIAGTLTCNGAYYNSEVYTDLYDALTLLPNGTRIKCPFGEEYRANPTTGKTTLYFAVPNLLGLVIRGWGNSGETYETEPDRTIGHVQKDGIPNIWAEWSQEVTGAEANFKGAVEIATEDGKYLQVDGHTSAPAGSYDYLIKFNAATISDCYVDNLPEVRVRNMALLPVIKY